MGKPRRSGNCNKFFLSKLFCKHNLKTFSMEKDEHAKLDNLNRKKCIMKMVIWFLKMVRRKTCVTV